MKLSNRVAALESATTPEEDIFLRAIVAQNTSMGICDGYRIAQEAYRLGIKSQQSEAAHREAAIKEGCNGLET